MNAAEPPLPEQGTSTLPSWRRRLVRPFLIAIVVAIIAAWNLADKRPDFTVIHAAARYAGGPVYDADWLLARQPGVNYPAPWAYPPPFLLMILPLALFAFKAAYALWIGLSSAAYVEAAGLRSGRWAPLIILSPLYFVFAGMGQTNLIMGALAVAGLTLVEAPALAGMLLGLAACIKPQMIVFVPFALIIAGRWRTLIFAGGTAVMACALATIAFGPHIWMDWINALPEFLRLNAQMGIMNVGPASPWMRALLGLSGLGLIWRAFRRDDIETQIVAVLGLAFLCSPHSKAYDLAVLAPAALAVIVRRGWWKGLPSIYFLTGLVSQWVGLLMFMLLTQFPLPNLRAMRAERSRRETRKRSVDRRA